MNKVTRDCQKGGPPITASKCMIIMKICTSVTSILIRYKKPKKKAKLFKAISSQLFASSAALLYHAQYKTSKILRKTREAKFINNLESKKCILVLWLKLRAMLCYPFCFISQCNKNPLSKAVGTLLLTDHCQLQKPILSFNLAHQQKKEFISDDKIQERYF